MNEFCVIQESCICWSLRQEASLVRPAGVKHLGFPRCPIGGGLFDLYVKPPILDSYLCTLQNICDYIYTYRPSPSLVPSELFWVTSLTLDNDSVETQRTYPNELSRCRMDVYQSYVVVGGLETARIGRSIRGCSRGYTSIPLIWTWS